MPLYAWTLETGSARSTGTGDIGAVTEAVEAFGTPGVAPADWIVELLVADGFAEGSAFYRHEGDVPWSLALCEA